ncbi:hypothetical protein GJAV_G00167120 [Gymnothorax javanicus]|nr:hypothetical protein GJAV_G00167120 [Gymnothorax javanicus]
MARLGQRKRNLRSVPQWVKLLWRCKVHDSLHFSATEHGKLEGDHQMAAAADNIYVEAEERGAVPAGDKELVQPVGQDGEAQAGMEDFLGPPPEYDEEEEERKYYRRKRLGVVKNVVAASVAGMIVYSVYLGLLQMQLILHYDETYRDVKYSNLFLEDIDRKMLMGINVTPIVSLLYTPVLIRFLGTKWTMFLASGIYALFVSTNYWERYYTLVPSAVAIGVAIVPLWASLGNYITRMAQQYYDFANYKEEHVQEQKKTPKGASHRYVIIFQSVFYILFHLSLVFAELPMGLFLNGFLYKYNHTLSRVTICGAASQGIIDGLNTTVLKNLPPSLLLIKVESGLMGAAFLSMIIFLALCGAAYRPAEEIDLRSIGWGNIFQLPFKHLRDYRLRLLCPFFIYSGFETLFAVTGLILSYGVCSVGMEKLWALVVAYGLSCSLCSTFALSLLRLPRPMLLLLGGAVHLVVLVGLMCWSPTPSPDRLHVMILLSIVWGFGSALNKTGLSILLGMLYEDKERLDFVFTIYHWWQAIAIFCVYLWSGLPMRAKISILLVALLMSGFCYWLMERRLAKNVPYRLPKIPRPKHKVKGYRYLEEDDSDESESEKSEVEEEEGASEDEFVGSHVSLDSQRPAYGEGGVRGRRRRRVEEDAYEQAGGIEEPTVLVELVRERKSRTDPKAKSKAGRVKIPPPVDPVEMVVMKERFSQYEMIVRALRFGFTEEVLQQKYEKEIGSQAEERAKQEAERHRALMAWNDAENLRLRKLREIRVQKELEEAQQKEAELAVLREKSLESFLAEKEQEILQLEEESKTFITLENLDERIEEALDNPKNYNFAIDKEGRVVKSTMLQ